MTVWRRSFSTSAVFLALSFSSSISTLSKGWLPSFVRPVLSPSAKEMGANDMYCMDFGLGRSKSSICTVYSPSPGQYSSGNLDLNEVNAEREAGLNGPEGVARGLTTPRTCKGVFPHLSSMRSISYGLFLYSIPTRKAFSTLRA